MTSLGEVRDRLTASRRRHALMLIAGSVVPVAVVIAALAMILIGKAGTVERQRADQRSSAAAELLAILGPDIARLDELKAGHIAGISRDANLTAAVRQGRLDGVLSNLGVWNSSGVDVYAAARAPARSRSIQVAVHRALRGSASLVELKHAIDHTTGKATGTLDAVEPVRSDYGRVIGAVDASFPLRPIVRDVSTDRRAIVILLSMTGLFLWLALLTPIARGAHAISKSAAPGQRRAVRKLRQALRADQIELVYQPQIDLASGGMTSVEALVRWRGGEHLRTPDSFLPAIETTPIMAELTDRVVELALGQLGQWRQLGEVPRVSINLSATDLADETLPTRIASALRRHGIPAELLTVEVTETALLEDPSCAQRVLEAITRLGVEVSVDDFGTGYASIARLWAFPISEVKIDRSFVRLDDDGRRDYLTAIIKFCQNLGLRVVAEGVEDAATLLHLRQISCDLAQGFHIARPLPPAEIERWRQRGAVLGGRGVVDQAGAAPARVTSGRSPSKSPESVWARQEYRPT